MRFKQVMELVASGVDVVGVSVIVIGAAISSAMFLRFVWRDFEEAYRAYRRSLGRAVLLGLEFLVAGDIIRTVAVSPSITNVTALAIIVLIRTFLSFSIELEIEHRWPWQSKRTVE
jgi:uncharacterized membrane protein